MIPAKTVKIEGKIKSLEERIQNKKEDLERSKEQFKEIFKRKRPAKDENAENSEGETKNE